MLKTMTNPKGTACTVRHMILQNILDGAGVSKLWHHISALLFLESASSLQSAAAVYLSERCCVLSFKAGCRQRPLAVASLCKQKSGRNECERAGKSQQTKSTDVLCVQLCPSASVVPHNLLQSSLFGTKKCVLTITLTRRHITQWIHSWLFY